MEEGRVWGVSLWLMPEGAARPRLARLIEGLAARLGTEPFPPHLTLLPGIEGRAPGDVLAAGRSLAAGLRPFTVRLESVEHREEYFRCLIARAAADGPLVAAHEAAARAFAREPDPAFLPHLSLVYGSLAPQRGQALAAEVAPDAAVAFEAARLHVWRTAGPVGDWLEIGAFPFGGGGWPPG
ncbi:MAG TPA: 2'-5' RNA ligase family protein [Vicinamibacteria bacterium]|nr:2'-5' RNA ligase family protein [Vicinamibacteria bacterium]